MISSVQRSPRMSIARPTLQNSGRSSSYMSANGSGSAAKGRELSGQAYGVVVGHQEAGPLEHAELGVGEQVERLFGHRQRVQLVLVRPQEQGRHLDQAVDLEQIGLGALRPAPRGPRPRARA